MVKLKLTDSTKSGQSDFCPPISDCVYTRIMAANVARDLIVPTDAHKVILTCNNLTATYWVKDKNAIGNIGAATIPSGDVSTGFAPMFCPAGLTVTPGQTLSIITSNDGVLIIAIFYE